MPWDEYITDKKIIFIPITITVCLDHLLFLVAPVACSFGCNMGKCQDQYKLWVLSPLCGCFFYLFPKCFLCTVFRYNEKKMKNKRKALVQYLGFRKWSGQNPGNSGVVFKLHLNCTSKTWWCLLCDFCLYVSSNFFCYIHLQYLILYSFIHKELLSSLHKVQSSIDLSTICWRRNILQ